MTFKKGQSGNPAGMKPGQFSLVAILKHKLQEIPEGDEEDNAHQVITGYVKELKKKPELVKDVIDRIDGKPKQNHEHTGEDGQPIEHVHRVIWQ